MAFEERKPMHRTWDIPGTIRFYVDIPGFQCEQFSDNYGMREFGIYDNNGYLLQFGSPLDDADV